MLGPRSCLSFCSACFEAFLSLGIGDVAPANAAPAFVRLAGDPFNSATIENCHFRHASKTDGWRF